MMIIEVYFRSSGRHVESFASLPHHSSLGILFDICGCLGRCPERSWPNLLRLGGQILICYQRISGELPGIIRMHKRPWWFLTNLYLGCNYIICPSNRQTLQLWSINQVLWRAFGLDELSPVSLDFLDPETAEAVVFVDFLLVVCLARFGLSVCMCAFWESDSNVWIVEILWCYCFFPAVEGAGSLSTFGARTWWCAGGGHGSRDAKHGGCKYE